MDASIGLDELVPIYGSRRSESFLRVVGSDLAPALPWGIFVTAVGIRATLLERRERKPGYDWREAVVIVTCGEARTTCHRHESAFRLRLCAGAATWHLSWPLRQIGKDPRAPATREGDWGQ
jgi:hypothetical protein